MVSHRCLSSKQSFTGKAADAIQVLLPSGWQWHPSLYTNKNQQCDRPLHKRLLLYNALSNASPPLAEGGLNFPSLIIRKSTYDLKFIGDLISGPQDIMWKLWSYADLCHASTARPSTKKHNPNKFRNRDKHFNLDPLSQRAHIKYSSLEPRVRHAVMTARKARLNIQSHLPSVNAKSSAPAAYHHALSGLPTTDHNELMSRGISTTGKLVCPEVSSLWAGHFISKVPLVYSSDEEEDDPLHISAWPAPAFAKLARQKHLLALSKTNWHPLINALPTFRPQDNIKVLPCHLNFRECICVFTDYQSILAPRYRGANL